MLKTLRHHFPNGCLYKHQCTIKFVFNAEIELQIIHIYHVIQICIKPEIC